MISEGIDWSICYRKVTISSVWQFSIIYGYCSGSLRWFMYWSAGCTWSSSGIEVGSRLFPNLKVFPSYNLLQNGIRYIDRGYQLVYSQRKYHAINCSSRWLSLMIYKFSLFCILLGLSGW
jgi:hypothetical protein